MNPYESGAVIDMNAAHKTVPTTVDADASICTPVAWRWRWKDRPGAGWNLSSVGVWRETEHIEAQPLYLHPPHQPKRDTLQDGVAGFGKTPALAMTDFDEQWLNSQAQGAPDA